MKNLNGECKYKAIYTGMIDDNMEIGSYCTENFIEYIPKSSNSNINNYIEEKIINIKGIHNARKIKK